jgi:hypothetical protein
LQTGDLPQQRGLAASGAADYAEKGVELDVERNIFEDGVTVLTGPENHRHMTHFDDGHRWCRSDRMESHVPLLDGPSAFFALF